jgi:hypothetical protein
MRCLGKESEEDTCLTAHGARNQPRTYRLLPRLVPNSLRTKLIGKIQYLCSQITVPFRFFLVVQLGARTRRGGEEPIREPSSRAGSERELGRQAKMATTHKKARQEGQARWIWKRNGDTLKQSGCGRTVTWLRCLRADSESKLKSIKT